MRDFQRKKAERRRYLALQQERYIKQKEEDGNGREPDGEIDAIENISSKNDTNECQDADVSTKIKIHRKRAISESIENQSSAKQGIEIGSKETENSFTAKEKKSSNSSFPDLVDIGEDGETSSPEKVKGPIARKLTFGHEVMDTPTKRS